MTITQCTGFGLGPAGLGLIPFAPVGQAMTRRVSSEIAVIISLFSASGAIQ